MYQMEVTTQTKPTLEELFNIHDLVEIKAASDKNSLKTFKCQKCGLTIKVGDGWYSSGPTGTDRLNSCQAPNPLKALAYVNTMLSTPQQEVVLVETSRHCLIALDYKTPLFNSMTHEQKAELTMGKRIQISNKSYGIRPFNDRIIAVTFRDHFIRDSYRFFRGSKDECLSFLSFYIESVEGFKPKIFRYKTKFGGLLKFTTFNLFEDAIRK